MTVKVSKKRRKVLFAASEVYPFAKSGGLADVAASLPKALSSEFEMRVIMPFYRSIDGLKYNIVPLDIFYTIPMNGKEYEVRLFGCSYGGITYYFVQSPVLSERAYLYGPPDHGYADNALRFAIFCRVIVKFLKEDGDFSVLHLNDWQTALAALLVKEDASIKTKTVYTIHNLAYQGIFPYHTLREIGLSERYYHMDALEFYGSISLMKAGIAYADCITTVSSEYAKEIQTKAFGFGLEGFLFYHRSKLSGILNGIDTDVFSPQTDPFIVYHYSAGNYTKKFENKKAYLKERGLKGQKKPLFIFIGRFTWQKGVDLLADVLERTAHLDMNIAILGEGETVYHQRLLRLVSKYRHIDLFFGYKETLSHRMYAAGDFLLMPSLYEPCGLNQMIAMRYGTLPVVHSVGGLKESVTPFESFSNHSTEGFGICFTEATADALYEAITEAVKLFRTARCKEINRHNMQCDFSWKQSAGKYAALYHKLERS